MTVKLWDAKTRKLMHTLDAHMSLAWCVAFSPDSKYLAAGGNGVMVWSVDSGKEQRLFSGHKLLVTGVAFDPAGQCLASCSYDGTVRIWDLATGKAISSLFSGDALLHGLAFSKDGARLAVAGDDRRVRIWNRRSINVAATDDASSQLAAMWAGEPDQVLVNESSAVRAVAFDPEGEYLASGAEQGTITIWSTSTWERVVNLRGGTGQIRSLAFSRDGNFLAGGAYVAPTIVWNLQLLHSRLRELKLDW
jgi:WD40 repeat protein